MRADRLIAALLLMQTRGRVTAGELAAELEVSVATARRDLEALSAAGIPVYPQPGRGGGWSLAGGGRTDLRSERLIDPWGLVDKDETWYLVAGTEQGRRTFRVDRILEAEPTGEPAARPDDFALASAWEQVVGEVEQRRSRTWATVLIDARFVPVLRDHFGRHCDVGSELDDGRTRVRVAAPTPLDIARNLAGWGAMVEVIEPPAVQAELARIGAELAGQYGLPQEGAR